MTHFLTEMRPTLCKSLPYPSLSPNNTLQSLLRQELRAQLLVHGSASHAKDWRAMEVWCALYC